MIDVSLLSDFSFTEIAKAAKHAMVSGLAGGTTLSINGRSIMRVTPEEARKIYDWAVANMLEDDGYSPGGMVLVKWGDRA